MKKIWIIVLVVVLAAGGGFWYWRTRAKGGTAETPTPTAKIERGPVRQSVTSTGKIVSNLDVEIKCKASGEVVKIPFDISQAVTKGALLLELDPRDEQQRVRQAEATVRASQARLINARESLALADENLRTDRQRAEAALTAAKARAADARSKAERTRELLAKKLASLEEAETAETAVTQAAAEAENAATAIEELKNQARTLEQARQQIRIAEAQVDNDQVNLDLARQRLAETRVVSPIDGVVTQRAVQIGQIISSGISNVGGGTTALVVSDLSRIFVLAAVDESDIGQVSPGQRVKVTADAYRSREFSGEVARISPRGTNVSNVVSFEVKLEVTARDKDLLRPEMTANVEILIDERPDALLSPADAIFRRGGKTWVTLQAADGTRTDREVTAGISDGRRTEIRSGLSVGETVLVQGSDSKWNGQGQRPGGPPMMRLH
ncbi:MAG: efflux RND transporter periplasmic adaptor subunit [Candidatus Methylomirabilia bacterium]